MQKCVKILEANRANHKFCFTNVAFLLSCTHKNVCLLVIMHTVFMHKADWSMIFFALRASFMEKKGFVSENQPMLKDVSLYWPAVLGSIMFYS